MFDGEHKPDESVRAHLGSCPDCVRRLADYETIRGALSRAVASEPDPGMNARIAAYVRAESAGLPPVAPRERDFSDSRAAWIFRIAALFILSGFFVYLLMDQMDANRTKTARPHVVSAEPAGWLTAETAQLLRVRASSTLPLPTGDNALLPVTDVTATPNPDGTVTLTLPRTTDTTQFFRVEVE